MDKAIWSAFLLFVFAFPALSQEIGLSAQQDSEPPKVTSSGENIYMTWHESAEGFSDIYFSRSTDRGRTFEPVQNLSDSALIRSDQEEIASSGNNVYIVWVEAPNQVFFTSSTDNGASFLPAKKLTDMGIDPQVASSEKKVVVAWEAEGQSDSSGIPQTDKFVTESVDGGVTFGDAINVSNDDGPWATQSQDDCDGYTVIGIFKKLGGRVSFIFRGRAVEFQQESALETYARAEIKSGRKSGDKVWIDRSHRRFSIFDHGIVSDATAKSEGWKQCGPFSQRTQSVINTVFAARACALIDGQLRCGAWFVN